MEIRNPNWRAPRSGQDWCDDELMLAVAWLKGLVLRLDIERRLDAAKECLAKARERQRDGERARLFDENDTTAWYMLQAETFATDRMFIAPEGVTRSVPYLSRIGKELPRMLSVKGAEERAARMMSSDKKQAVGMGPNPRSRAICWFHLRPTRSHGLIGPDRANENLYCQSRTRFAFPPFRATLRSIASGERRGR